MGVIDFLLALARLLHRLRLLNRLLPLLLKQKNLSSLKTTLMSTRLR